MPPPQPPRRRAGLVATIVCGCLVLVGAAVAFVIAVSGEDSGGGTAAGGSSGAAPEPPAAKPVQAPPRACELLSPAHLAAIVPGKVKEPFGNDPEPSGQGQIATRCSWANVPSVNGQRFPAVTVIVTATAANTEDVARTVFQNSVECDGRASKRISVEGADEACLQHGAFDANNAPVGNTKVAARRETVVVLFHYSHAAMPIEAIDNTASAGATSVLAAIGQSR
ncbi:hypothetical protein [Actinosynnema sp. ALI-1.44]|uniref:hypothetical protein n=1 Tax=Actinosynnema sp. ALI-1.44 TaxID=1933779 RepID=UPI0011773820|nr:hypothetical protein [Actinosynnema sp. ALI-1.44]